MSALTDHADKIRAQVDIVDVVGRYVELRRGGINLKGLCPFHSEKTPSFTVSPSKGIFHCFGCGEGGDVIKFVQKIERLEWVEALRLLSEQYGIPMPERERPGSSEAREKARDERERLLEISKLAARHFAGHLERALADPASEASRYLGRRQIDMEAVRRFELGLAVDAWQDLTDAGRRAGFDADTLVLAGLAIRHPEKNRVYDRFRKRLIFPIHDNVGRPIAFGGRVFVSDAAPDEPKYVNSPETPLYRKGQQLYALHLAKDSIMRARRALLMEGYMDVIRAHRCGFPEAVATCGTALTDEQARALRRYADEVVFVYDGDAAGQKAMLRGTEVLLDHEFKVRVVALPDGHDPDSFLLEKGPEAFRQAIAGAVPFLDFFLDAAAARYGRSTPDAKVQVIEEVLPLIRRVRNPIAASEYARRSADYLEIDPALVVSQLGRAAPAPELREKIVAVQPPREMPPLRDRMLLRLLIESPHARPLFFEQVEPHWIEHDRVRWFYELLRQTEPPDAISYDYLHSRAEQEEDHALLRALALDDEPLDDSERTIVNVIARLRRHAIAREAEQIRRELARRPAPSSDPADPAADNVVPVVDPLVQRIDSITRPLPTVGRDFFLKPGERPQGP